VNIESNGPHAGNAPATGPIDSADLQGRFVIAMPNLEDPNFHKTVVLVCEHDKAGSMGIVVNRSMPFTLGQVYEGQEIEGRDHDDEPVHYGGPVQTEVGFILYRGDGPLAGAVHVAGDVYLGTSVELLRMIADGEGPAPFLFALGYAGWAPEQLDSELARNDWLVAQGDPEIIFSLPAEERWEHAVRSLGIEPGHLANMSGSA